MFLLVSCSLACVPSAKGKGKGGGVMREKRKRETGEEGRELPLSPSLLHLLLTLAVHLHFNTFRVLYTVKANEQKKKRTKIYNKETGEFQNQSRFINCGL